jgi:transposase
MRKSRLSCYKQIILVEHFVAGTTARCASKLAAVNKNTAILYFQGHQKMIAHQLEQESLDVFDGEIEVDESYFGGTIRDADADYQAENCARQRRLFGLLGSV